MTSCQCIGECRYPCRNIRNLKNGNATGCERKTLPISGGMYANAYRTHRTVISSNHVACCTNGSRYARSRIYRSWIKLKGSFITARNVRDFLGMQSHEVMSLAQEDTRGGRTRDKDALTYGETVKPVSRSSGCERSQRGQSIAGSKILKKQYSQAKRPVPVSWYGRDAISTRANG